MTDPGNPAGFDPWARRADRDLRNRLGSALAQSLLTHDAEAFRQALGREEGGPLTPPQRRWLEGRRARGLAALECAAGLDGPLDLGLLCFTEGLFFEAHELWEEAWQSRRRGSDRREALKGLVQAAGAGLMAERGSAGQAVAVSLAAKAARRLERHAAALADWGGLPRVSAGLGSLVTSRYRAS